MSAGWDDAPVRAKAVAVAALGVMLGLVTGLVEVRLGGQLYPLLIGLTATFATVLWLAGRWIAAPIERLARQLEVMARARKPEDLNRLPTGRSDEVGRIAQAVRSMGVAAVRHHHEARQLRQTLDSRVVSATATATRQLKVLTMRDPLTELGNRRFLDEHLEKLLSVSRASHVELVCILIDVDKFKDVNDVLGHQAGDDLLVLLGRLIKGSVREDDLSVRLGGDEFVVLMPGAPMDRVERFCETLRKLFRQQAKTMFPSGPHANLSMGVATLLADGCEHGESLLAAADARLYEAKRRGRGCTVGLHDRTLGTEPMSMAG